MLRPGLLTRAHGHTGIPRWAGIRRRACPRGILAFLRARKHRIDGQRSPWLVHTLSVSAKFAYVGRSATGLCRSGVATRIAVSS